MSSRCAPAKKVVRVHPYALNRSMRPFSSEAVPRLADRLVNLDLAQAIRFLERLEDGIGSARLTAFEQALSQTDPAVCTGARTRRKASV
jgi:hypothetical protein